MGNYKRPADGYDSKQSLEVKDSSICRVCRGRKYTLVESSTTNQSKTAYEKKVCPACNDKADTLPTVDSNGRFHAGKRAISGTGFLRNNKRRRKKST
jgi:hypothetical protein